MYDSTPDSIKRAVDDINYLRQKYPRLKAINIANRPQILQLLNTYFGTTLTITDIWGTAGTTVKICIHISGTICLYLKIS